MTPSTPNSFQEFPKLYRYARECIITEKLDGTNAQVFVWNEDHMILVPGTEDKYERAGPPPEGIPFIENGASYHIAAGSRNRWITPESDNARFAKWVLEHSADLAIHLGHGRHFGEWWGNGIQRGYGLKNGDKRFSLFNVQRWCLHDATPDVIPSNNPLAPVRYQEKLPECCGLVPIINAGNFEHISQMAEDAVQLLRNEGSLAVPGFDRPEGIVIFHTAGNFGLKKTLENDEKPKSLAS